MFSPTYCLTTQYSLLISILSIHYSSMGKRKNFSKPTLVSPRNILFLFTKSIMVLFNQFLSCKISIKTRYLLLVTYGWSCHARRLFASFLTLILLSSDWPVLAVGFNAPFCVCMHVSPPTKQWLLRVLLLAPHFYPTLCSWVHRIASASLLFSFALHAKTRSGSLESIIVLLHPS